MNIFVSNSCPFESARFLDDKRVVKMVLESAQMLSTAIHCVGGYGPYKKTHVNHPCSVWARRSAENYHWLLSHFKALCNEYTRRYGKTHKCEQYLELFWKGMSIMPQGGLTPFANCAANESIGVSFKDVKDVPSAYKRYLYARWINDKREPTWYGQKLLGKGAVNVKI